jgi:hypothetical protein
MLALHCAITAYHLHEWVWGDWLKTDDRVRQQLGIHDRKRKSFLAYIDRACPWFETIQDLVNGTKHFIRNQHFKTIRVSAPPFILDDLYAGLDEGSWDEPIPYMADPHGKGCLLIDYGPGMGVHRWMPAASLLEVVVRFWREFFARFHPDPEVRTQVREWRLLPF